MLGIDGTSILGGAGLATTIVQEARAGEAERLRDERDRTHAAMTAEFVIEALVREIPAGG